MLVYVFLDRLDSILFKTTITCENDSDHTIVGSLRIHITHMFEQKKRIFQIDRLDNSISLMEPNIQF
jgi:hypothetical protein